MPTSRLLRVLAAVGLALLPVAWPVAVSPLVSDGSREVGADVVLTFRDGRIDESSGLVVRDRHVLTTNDSGDGPFLYAVARRTGRTTAVFRYAEEEPADVEALATGPDGAVWVADIGDNRRGRGTVRLFRLPPLGALSRSPVGEQADVRVAATVVDLRYPDGPHDAEALLVHPTSGATYVVTKRPVGGGEVFAVPRRVRPGQVAQMRAVGRVPGMVTDAAFLPDGRHVVVRTYGTAALLSYPDFTLLGSFPLPVQEQGEAIAVGPEGRLYVSGEGEGAGVLSLDLPDPASFARSPTAAAPSSGQEPAEPARRPSEPEAFDPQPFFGVGAGPLLALAAVGAAVLLGARGAVRAARRRSRRRP